MNETENLNRSVPAASEYISDNFKPSDRIAVLVLNRNLGETTQRITTAQKAASPEFQAWLRYKNANGADIYVGMNPLKQDASIRTKDDIETIRHLYLDLDHGGSVGLEAIKHSDLVPQPNYVLNTSPDKFQVVWKAEGITLEEAEALQHAMVRVADAAGSLIPSVCRSTHWPFDRLRPSNPRTGSSRIHPRWSGIELLLCRRAPSDCNGQYCL